MAEFLPPTPAPSKEASFDAAFVLSQMKLHPDEDIRKTFSRDSYPEIQSVVGHVALVLSARKPAELGIIIADQMGQYLADPKSRKGLEEEVDPELLAQYNAERAQFSGSFTPNLAQEVNVGRSFNIALQNLIDLQPQDVEEELDNDEEPPSEEVAQGMETIFREDRRTAAVLLTQFRLAAFGQQQKGLTQNFKARMKGMAYLTEITFDRIYPAPFISVDVEELLREAEEKNPKDSPVEPEPRTELEKTIFDATDNKPHLLSLNEDEEEKELPRKGSRHATLRIKRLGKETGQVLDEINDALIGTKKVAKTSPSKPVTIEDMDKLLNLPPIPTTFEDDLSA